MRVDDYWDLVLVVGWLGPVGASVLVPLPSLVRLPIVLPFVGLLPGYALVTALYPRTAEPASTGTGRSSHDRLDGAERVWIGIGLSLAVVGLVGLGLNWVTESVAVVPFVVSVAAVTLVASAVAVIRRSRVPPTRRYVPPLPSGGLIDRNERLSRGTEIALTGLVAVTVVAAVGTLTLGASGGSPTQLYLLNDDGVADEYPTNLTVDESASVVVGIDNGDEEPRRFTAVVLFQILEPDGSVADSRRITTVEATLADGETARRTVTVTPEAATERARLVVLLYRGDPPANPTLDSADRSTRLIVTVESG